MLELELPIPPSVNSYWRAVPNRTKAGTHGARNVLSTAAREYRSSAVKAVSKLHLGAPLTGRLVVDHEISGKSNQSYDLDNFTKGLWDALTHAGVWIDDSQIDRYTMTRAKPGRGTIKITIQETREK